MQGESHQTPQRPQVLILSGLAPPVGAGVASCIQSCYFSWAVIHCSADIALIRARPRKFMLRSR